MKKSSLNREWKFVRGCVPSLKVLQMSGKEAENICLPHDAMIFEERKVDTKNGGATGFYPGGVYTYFKTLYAPDDWSEKNVIIEFEGVYQTAMVYVNGVLVKTNTYGYSNFYVCLDRYLRYGEDNEIKVIADNAGEQNSRWYTGSGIYRNVNLYVGNLVQIPVNGVSVTTLDADTEVAAVEFVTRVENLSRKKEKLTLSISMSDEEGNAFGDKVHVTSFAGSQNEIRQMITIRNPKLWSCDVPNLYHCNVKLFSGENVIDEETLDFGVRKISLDAVHGLRLNGEMLKLRGTCIHHDNGILGAATYEQAEYRKCVLLKQAGFNAIRSAHHPAGKALLDACDKLGLVVMDELCDMWTIHKNNNDYASLFLDEWENIADAMVVKDYNHACVIMYSVGNEIQEIGTERGAEINRTICNYFKKLDATRFTTNGMNALNAAGAKIYPILQELAPLLKKDSGENGSNDNSGSNAINSFMRLMEGEAGEAFAKHPLITEVLQESSESMDIIGLNYLTGRHLLDAELYPNKCVLGTETFPADIARLWKTVNASNQVLGDFTWTGYDYLGEAGCGIFYYDGKTNFGSYYPDCLAYIGDINLTGYRRPISYLREIVYGLRKEPYIAVERVDKHGMVHSKTPWMLKDNISSWTWDGYEGKTAVIDVYSADEEVELFLNDISLGRKSAGKENGFVATFEHVYEPGKLVAVGYKDGMETYRYELLTSKPEVHLAVAATKTMLRKDTDDLSFVTINLTDEHGVDNPWAKREISVSAEDGLEILAMGSANPQTMTSYQSTTWDTYDGYVLVVVGAGRTTGKVDLTISDNMGEIKKISFDIV